MVRDVREGLTRPAKQLSSKYSTTSAAQSCSRITQLPEYYLTRAERSLLEQRIPEIIQAVQPCSLVEHGPAVPPNATDSRGDALKGLRGVLRADDLSKDFLEATALQFAADYRDIRITPVVSDITEPLRCPLANPTLVAFLGSTIGNFPREPAIRLLSHIAQAMGSTDRFLLGADLRKDPEIIDRAYNDSKGVTAAFNLNVLERLNRELGADFPVADYDHRAFYSSEHQRVEMHLIARNAHKVVIPEIGRYSSERAKAFELSSATSTIARHSRIFSRQPGS